MSGLLNRFTRSLREVGKEEQPAMVEPLTVRRLPFTNPSQGLPVHAYVVEVAGDLLLFDCR